MHAFFCKQNIWIHTSSVVSNSPCNHLWSVVCRLEDITSLVHRRGLASGSPVPWYLLRPVQAQEVDVTNIVIFASTLTPWPLPLIYLLITSFPSIYFPIPFNQHSIRWVIALNPNSLISMPPMRLPHVLKGCSANHHLLTSSSPHQAMYERLVVHPHHSVLSFPLSIHSFTSISILSFILTHCLLVYCHPLLYFFFHSPLLTLLITLSVLHFFFSF